MTVGASVIFQFLLQSSNVLGWVWWLPISKMQTMDGSMLTAFQEAKLHEKALLWATDVFDLWWDRNEYSEVSMVKQTQLDEVTSESHIFIGFN